MRQLKLHMMITVDGLIADSHGKLDQSWNVWDEEMRAFYNKLFASLDTLMYGRVIYEEMVPAWAEIAAGNSPPGFIATESDLVFARRVGEMHKIVVSNSLDHVEGGTTLVRGDLVKEITAIKEQPGSDILLYCGPDLTATLTELRLIDEYMLYVHPTVLGQGVPLFAEVSDPVRLSLAKSTTFRSGALLQQYRPVYDG